MHIDRIIKSGSEHAHQVALFQYCAIAHTHGWEVADQWALIGNGAFMHSKWRAGRPPTVPALEWFHAIPNGGSRGDNKQSQMIRGAQLKNEGVRKGIPDCFLPWHSKQYGGWHGMYIEMKAPKMKPKKSGKGGMSDEQIAFGTYALNVGYAHVVCYSWLEAVNNLKSYIGS